MKDADSGEPPIGSASAAGKVILIGEHAVVYGEPALAVPVTEVAAIAEVHAAGLELSLTAHFPMEEGRAVVSASLESLRSPEGVLRALASHAETPSQGNGTEAIRTGDLDVGEKDDGGLDDGELCDAEQDDGGLDDGERIVDLRGSEESIASKPVDEDGRAILAVIAAAMKGASLDRLPEWSLQVRSQVPTGRGMGSSAAVAVATARAIRVAAGCRRDPATEAYAALQGERVTHGTPSGIDTSVISLERPISFTRSDGAVPLAIARPFHLVVADSGTPGRTRDMVAGVKERRALKTVDYDRWLKRIGALSLDAISALAEGDLVALGDLMDESQSILASIGVSTPEIDVLVESARQAGALGAKLSGAGGGGVVIALADDESLALWIEEAMRRSGAPRVYRSTIERSEHGS